LDLQQPHEPSRQRESFVPENFGVHDEGEGLVIHSDRSKRRPFCCFVDTLNKGTSDSPPRRAPEQQLELQYLGR
jgi:hypothetical protein